MSRGMRAAGRRMVRCVLVWLVVTVAVGLGLVAVRDELAAAIAGGWSGLPFEDLLVRGTAVVAALAGAWIWLVTTVTVVEAAGRIERPTVASGPVRRLVLAACGVALASGVVAAPAGAASGHADGTDASTTSPQGRLLGGLPLPDRASIHDSPAPAPVAAQPVAHRAPLDAGSVVVLTGDSLWSIATATLPAGADDEQVDAPLARDLRRQPGRHRPRPRRHPSRAAPDAATRLTRPSLEPPRKGLDMTSKPNASVTPLRAPVGVASVQGSLALELAPRFDPPSPALVPSIPSPDVVDIDDAEHARVDAFVGRYLRAAVEIVAGDRPASQLVRHTQPEVYADLRRRAVLVARAGGHTPGQGRTVEAIRPQLMSARTSFVREDAVEASMTVRYGARCRAVAARFERERDRWICVALEFA